MTMNNPQRIQLQQYHDADLLYPGDLTTERSKKNTLVFFVQRVEEEVLQLTIDKLIENFG